MPRTPNPKHAETFAASGIVKAMLDSCCWSDHTGSFEFRVLMKDGPTALVVGRLEAGRLVSVEGFDEPADESEAAELRAMAALAAKGA